MNVRGRDLSRSTVRRHAPLLAGAAVCGLLYAAASLRYEHFFSLQVLVNFFEDNASLGLAAVGLTFVILSGGIDLSVGSVMALSSIVTAVLIERHGWPPGLAYGAAVALGAVFGTGMGLAVHSLGLAPFIVTLAGMFLARGLAWIVHLEPLPISGSAHAAWAARAVPLAGGVDLPLVAMILLGAVLLGTYVSKWTAFGRSVYAIGGDADAARLMGLPVGRTVVGVHALSGACSAGAGVVFTLYQSAGNPSAGVGLELEAIAAVVVGGTLLTGGAGTVPGTLIGVLIFGIIQTTLMFEGTLSSWWTRVAVGLMLLVFVVLQRLFTDRGVP